MIVRFQSFVWIRKTLVSKSAAPQPHRPVTVREQNINVSRKAPPHFYDFSQRTLWIWTPLCKQHCLQMSAERIHVVAAAQQKWKKKIWSAAGRNRRCHSDRPVVQQHRGCEGAGIVVVTQACSRLSGLWPHYSRVFAESNLWSCRKRLWINILELI